MVVIEGSYGQCQDCYKCIRFCPLKAIRISQGQAEIIAEECINCGLCTRICPQQAKELVDQWSVFQTWLEKKEEIVVSLAPSYLGLQQEPYALVATLYKLGIKRVEEAAWVVPEVSAHYWQSEHLAPALTSACPALVNLIQKYYPSLVKNLVPVLSPMLVHGRSLKQRYPEAKVVYIDSCPAKKVECFQFTEVDLALTYQEIFSGFKKLELAVEELEPVQPDVTGTATARLFSTESGWRESRSETELSGKLWVVDGFDECLQFLDALQDGHVDGQWAELMICKGGCLGGAGWNDQDPYYVRQSRLLTRVATHQTTSRPSWTAVEMQREFVATPYQPQPVTEAEINQVLISNGRLHPSEQLDCGACGYNTCREKAIAVARGKAELEMCIPYMRARAESLSNIIIENTPNGIIVTDCDLNILAVNPAAERIFNCRGQDYLNKNVEHLFDSSNYKLAKSQGRLISDIVYYPQYSKITKQLIFPVKRPNVIVGIFLDITKEQQQTQELAKLKEETLAKANEVIENQMRVAQEVASLLGETTAETQILLSRLIKLIEQEDSSFTDGLEVG